MVKNLTILECIRGKCTLFMYVIAEDQAMSVQMRRLDPLPDLSCIFFIQQILLFSKFENAFERNGLDSFDTEFCEFIFRFRETEIGHSL